jgi:hypothetical protein
MEMGLTGACVLKMATAHFCVTTPSQTPNSLQSWKSSQGESGNLASSSHPNAL